MSDCWDNIIVGMKVEVENRDADGLGSIFAEAFWVASVLRISGYKALLRYEGFGQVSILVVPRIHSRVARNIISGTAYVEKIQTNLLY